jgi:hypothetical protein
MIHPSQPENTMADARYFATINGEPVRLQNVRYTDKQANRRPAYEREVIVGDKTVRGDSYSFAVGQGPDGKLYAADRLIFRKAAPSNHKCGAKCRHAKGGQCECECGGKFHGAGN